MRSRSSTHTSVAGFPATNGTEKNLVGTPRSYHYPGWSPDGKYLTYILGMGARMLSLWAVPVVGDAQPVAVVQPPSQRSNIYGYRVSPDGRLVAYISDESGQNELYITTFPEGKGKWKVSSGGASYPRWSGNGKEVFFNNLNDDFFSCPLTFKGSEIEVARPSISSTRACPESECLMTFRGTVNAFW